MKGKSITIPAETAAAVLMACVAIDDILQAGTVTGDILEELNYIQPYLQDYISMA